MTLEELKTLVKTKAARGVIQKSSDMEGSDTDVLRSLVNTALDKHTSKKHKKVCLLFLPTVDDAVLFDTTM